MKENVRNPVVETIVNDPMIKLFKNSATEEDYAAFADRVKAGIAYEGTPEGLAKLQKRVDFVNKIYE